jgi:UDP-3-O-[3-hydroxymyristoyl] glucosamine N-acyltransferase
MKIKPLKTSDLCILLQLNYIGENLLISGFNSIDNLKKNELGFSNNSNKKDCILITNKKDKLTKQTKIFSINPRLDFCRAIKIFEEKKLIIKNMKKNYIEKTSIINGNIDGENIFIGKNTIVEKNAIIKSNVKIGNNCIIRSGAIIGGDGFGFEKFKNKIIRFAHWGGVEIKNEVEIGYNSCIDRGTFSNTIIDSYTKIDNHVHIGHNVKIGKRNLITAHAQIAGSVIIENNCFISPSASIANKIRISNNCFVGIGSIVVRDLKKNSRVFGNPAKNLKQFKN